MLVAEGEVEVCCAKIGEFPGKDSIPPLETAQSNYAIV